MERTQDAAQRRRPGAALGATLLALALPAQAARMHESVMRVPVVSGVEQAYIDVTVFKPRGEGPFPFVVLSHGSPRVEAFLARIGARR